MATIELNYKSLGQGQPIIILHGLFGTLDNWQTIARQLSEQYSVYIIDQRNHGRSPHTDEFSYPILANDLQHFMESHWIYKAVVIGHSMGGKTAMEFAIQYPDMVEKLVVLDIAPKTYTGGHEVILDTLNAIDLTQIKDRKEAEAYMLQRIPDFGTRQFLLKNLTRDEKTGVFTWKMNLPVLQREYEAILGNISSGTYEGDTLFIRGANSDYIKDADIPTLLQYFPKMQLETIANAGHWVHADQPKQLLALIERYL